MAAVEKLFVAHLRRGQLLELFEGRSTRPEALDIFSERTLQPAAGEIVAIWRTRPVTDQWTMPDGLVANEREIDDLLAWSATYLRGMGPLTSLVRVLSPGQIRALLDPTPVDLRDVMGGVIGIVLCEVLMHARQSLPLGSVSTAAAQSTLSFALLRALHVGLGKHSLEGIAENFSRLRRDTRQSISPQAIDAILGVVESLVGISTSGTEVRATAGVMGWWREIRRGTDLYEVARRVLPGSVDLLNMRSFGDLRDMTAEERVTLLDEIAPSLAHGPGLRPDRAFALALATFVCRPGLEQQAGLLAEYASKLPEAWLWLGALQSKSPVSDALGVGEALGWWVARELLRHEEFLSAPRADISAAELIVMLRGRSRYAGKLLGRTRIEVEVAPLVSVLIRGLDREEHSESEPDRKQAPVQKAGAASGRSSIADVEMGLAEALHLLRDLHAACLSGGPMKRQRRRLGGTIINDRDT